MGEAQKVPATPRRADALLSAWASTPTRMCTNDIITGGGGRMRQVSKNKSGAMLSRHAAEHERGARGRGEVRARGAHMCTDQCQPGRARTPRRARSRPTRKASMQERKQRLQPRCTAAARTCHHPMSMVMVMMMIEDDD